MANAAAVACFLRATDLNAAALMELFEQTKELKTERSRGQRRDTLRGRHVALYMEKPSVRTRISFTVGVRELGADIVELTGTGTKVGQGEHPYDFGAVVARYCHCLVARVFSDDTLQEMAAGSRLPVINALSDHHHPCQALADYFTLHERFGSLEGLTLAYVGDGNNNVTHSLMEMGAALGVHLRIASPPGFTPDVAIAKATGTEIINDPRQAVRGADVLYTDTWTSMGREAERMARRDALRRYRIDSVLLAEASPRAVVMHCLPAVRGEEIDADILHGPRSVIFEEAENRLHTQKALLLRLFGV